MKVVYFDCFSGISGDMSLASLIDAGANLKYIENELKKLPIEAFEIKSYQVIKKSLSAKKIDVLINTEKSLPVRNYKEIISIIDNSELPLIVKENSKKIFDVIAKAEAKIHNTPIEKVHFHEIGALDSIIDIIGVCLALYNLNIEKIFSPPIPLGTGEISIQHGVYPNPSPATVEILKGYPIYFSDLKMELTTPTGAGIIAAMSNYCKKIPQIVVESVGYGAGTKDFSDRPNVLRAIVGNIDEFEYCSEQYQFQDQHSTSINHPHSHITK